MRWRRTSAIIVLPPRCAIPSALSTEIHCPLSHTACRRPDLRLIGPVQCVATAFSKTSCKNPHSSLRRTVEIAMKVSKDFLKDATSHYLHFVWHRRLQHFLKRSRPIE